MTDRKEVERRLLCHSIAGDAGEEKISAACEKGCFFIEQRLKRTADENGEDVLAAAEAASRFFLFCRLLQNDVSFKAGDVSLSENASETFKREKELFELALSSASSVLEDGGFCFELSS